MFGDAAPDIFQVEQSVWDASLTSSAVSTTVDAIENEAVLKNIEKKRWVYAHRERMEIKKRNV